MNDTPTPHPEPAPLFATLAELAAALTRASASATPQPAALARWLADRPEEIAFQSVRTMAAMSGSNANTVLRLARVLGFAGFEPLQTAVRDLLRRETTADLASRVAALRAHSSKDLGASLRAATLGNIEALYTDALDAQIARCAEALLAARRVHCLGVRSCYSVAHYLSYTGTMAFANFQPTPAQPGLIVDAMSTCTPEDIVIAISYAQYSAEVIRGCDIAQGCGARIIALTDSHASPIARGAWQVFRLPMAGPQLLPSLTGAFHLVERLLVELASRSPDTEQRLRDAEARLLRYGGYVRQSFTTKVRDS
ncbi:MAG: MurR/RpiR family transcriptional regulator [Phaeovulum sp.]|uniref:MurR/RpiR family transcriptional regulator n=1 Tax=Phaeovulum sp. TaxID=2934796 RepID=UPI00273223B6|nr:MurR/RpiR family transcriptional regulator [Phaeovulum sp.]MDP2063424.1 MurR/RpiR family transcriptional regulator [Phaeovulum sp.]